MAYVAVYATEADPEPQRFELNECAVFGRSSGNDVWVDDPNVSRQHCKLERVDGRWMLFDLGSTNGTWLDAARVRRYALKDGETFYIGDTRIVFHTDQRFEHRPADPHEARSASMVLESCEASLVAAAAGNLMRRLPEPRATVAGPCPRADDKMPLAFRRPPATPMVSLTITSQ